MLRVAYDGPSFSGFGWQREAPLPTVSGTLHEAILPLLEGRHSLRINCAGRTDAGVSALGQRVSFYAWPQLDAAEIVAAVARASPTPGALRVLEAARVPRSYHATFGTRWRRYAYLLPPKRGASRREVEAEAAALHALLRTLAGAPHDFGALGRGVPKGKDTVTTLHRASARAVELDGGAATRIDLVGDRFIRRQVRVLVATAVDARAGGEASAQDLREEGGEPRGSLLERATSGDQKRTAHPAPAAGLCFMDAGAQDWAQI